MLYPIPCHIIVQTYCVGGLQAQAFSREYDLLVKKSQTTLVGTLNQSESVLTQLFMLGLLLSASWSKLLSSKIYHSRTEPQKNVTIFALIKAAF